MDEQLAAKATSGRGKVKNDWRCSGQNLTLRENKALLHSFGALTKRMSRR